MLRQRPSWLPLLQFMIQTRGARRAARRSHRQAEQRDRNGLHSCRHDAEVLRYEFDVLALEGEDLRGLSLHLRKTSSPGA